MNDWRPRMRKAVRHLAEQLADIRAGTLSVGFVETFRASLHGNSVAVGRMASVTSRGDPTVEILREKRPGARHKMSSSTIAPVVAVRQGGDHVF
jgi:hypothetical protein